MRLIKLYASGEIYVNVDKIEVLRKEDNFTVVALMNGNNNNYIRVEETPEEIIQLIKQAEEIWYGINYFYNNGIKKELYVDRYRKEENKAIKIEF